MAGSMPGAPAKTAASQEAKQKAAGTLDVNYAALESQGLISSGPDGALGRDIWRGSKRSDLVKWLPALPANGQYRILQDLSRRLLLSTTDARLIKNDVRPEPGEDLTTLRIEKLLERGAYGDAFALYTKYQGQPYHDRFARAGVLAALYSRQPAIACLETMTAAGRFADSAFWQQANGVCRYILSKAGETKTERPKIPGSAILQKIVDKDDYRFKVRKPDDLDKLTPLEAAVLAADSRLDLGTMDVSGSADLPLHVLTLLIDDPTMQAEERYILTLQAVKRGAIPVSRLAEFYEKQADALFGKKKGKKTSLIDYRQLSGWKRPVYLYRAATGAAAGQEQAAIVKRALDLVPEYGTQAFWPLADVIAGLDPETLGKDSIRTAFAVLLESGSDIPDAWGKSRFAELGKTNTPEKADLLQYAAYRIGKLSTEESSQDIDFSKTSETFGPERGKLLKIIYEKLDSDTKLHNSVATEFYEKHPDLTSAFDYVMPLSSLMECLESAERDRRLGEVILLSSIALSEAVPDQSNGGVLEEVIGGLSAVGLTNEARALAREVVLGFDKNIKEKN